MLVIVEKLTFQKCINEIKLLKKLEYWVSLTQEMVCYQASTHMNEWVRSDACWQKVSQSLTGKQMWTLAS